MKDNIDTLTKRAGCLMAVALLTYLSLGGASSAVFDTSPNLEKSAEKFDTVVDTYLATHLKNQHVEEQSRFISRNSPAFQTHKPEWIRTLNEAHSHFASYQKQTQDLKKSLPAARQDKEKLNRQRQSLLQQPGNKLPAPATTQRQQYEKVDDEIKSADETLGRIDRYLQGHETRIQDAKQKFAKNEEYLYGPLPPK
jgi:uncharacterized protein (DUF3084 family)